MHNSLIVRPAEKSDIQALTDLLFQLFSIEEDFEFNGEKHTKGLELLINETERARVLVAEIDKKVIGMLHAQTNISTVEGGLAITLEDMVIDKNFRGLGIGKQLMQEMQKWAENKGITRMQLLADKSNSPALAYYEKLGWKQTKMFCLRKYTSIHNT